MSLQAMLQEGIRYAPTYRPVDNSDHLPMTLCAMHGLGATDAELAVFRDGYVGRLHEWEAVGRVMGWQEGLGERALYPVLLQWFLAERDPGERAQLRGQVLETCLSSLALEAFHPLIRLGYAVQFNCREEEAAALAYLVSVHRALPTGLQVVDLEERLIAQAAAGALSLHAGRFGAGMLELANSGRYPVGTAGSLDEIAAVALKLYRSTRNFFALHLVTVTQALRLVVSPATEALAVSSLTGAVMASHLVLGSPPLSGAVMAAPASLDPEHAIKYAWACLSEYRSSGNPLYEEEVDLFRNAGLVPAWVKSVRESD